MSSIVKNLSIIKSKNYSRTLKTKLLKKYIFYNGEKFSLEKNKFFKKIYFHKLIRPDWRFASYETIPPTPPRTIFFTENNSNFMIGLKIIKNKEYVGKISCEEGNFGQLNYYKNNKLFKSNGNYFVLTNKNEELKVENSISKKNFLKLINELISKDDEKKLEEITNFNFSDLIRDIKNLKQSDFEFIGSNIRWFNHKLNKKGLHLLRCILAEKIFYKKIKKYLNNKNFNFFYEKGFIKFPFDQVKLLKEMMSYLMNGHEKKQTKIKWKESYVKYLKNDNQREFHIDSFHNTFKVWVYGGNIKTKHGPLNIIPNSQKNDFNKLKWLYKISNSNTGLTEPSFRLKKNYFRLFNKSIEILPLNNKKTIILVNTYAFHKRGAIGKNTLRKSLRIAGDNDGGLKRQNPFK